jgi:DNA-binding NarL/FixJ family response regulator
MGTSTFVGRVEALRTFDTARAAASLGLPQVVLVVAAGGIGKSALLTAFRDRLDGCRVLSASGDEVEAVLEFGLLQQLLDTGATWADPFTAGAAVLRHLGQASANPATVILIDDAHVSDPQSLQALGFAARRLRTDPVLLVLACRPESAHRLPSALAGRADQAGARISLAGLSAGEIQDLAAALGTGPLTHRAAERLRSHTDGSPLHLRALLDELPVETIEAVDRRLPAPRSFAQLVLRDLAAASPGARRVVSAAAVLGEHAEVADVLAVADADPHTAGPVLEDLHRLGVLGLPAGETSLGFSHPLVRAAVYDDLGPGKRIHLHERAARVLSGSASLRHRVAAAIGPDPELAADLEREADSQARAGHLSAAADAWLSASRLSATSADADRRLLCGVGWLLASGDVAAAVAHTDRVDALAPTGPRLHLQARIAWLTGHYDQAAQLGHQAWEQMDDLELDERDQLAAMLAQIEILRDHGADAARWADAALEGNLDPAQAPQTRAIRAYGLSTSGQSRAALRALGDLPADPRLVPPFRHPELAARGSVRVAIGDLADGEADLEVVASLAHGDVSPYRLTARAQLVVARFRTGNWTAAQVVAEEAVALAADMEQPWLGGFIHATAALVPAGRGDWDTAQRHVDAAGAMAALLQETATAAYADDAAIFLAMCRGEPADLVGRAQRLRQAPPGATSYEPGLLTWPVHLVSALVQLRRLDEAEAELDRVAELARAREHRSRLAAAARLRGELADARRTPDEAREAFEEAIALGDERVDADERAMAHLAYGAFLRRRGERRAAIEQLTRARDRYLELGAAPFSTRCDQLLKACGAHPTRQMVRPDVLTPQERAVATLVAAGRTNQQVADELVLSVKTIGYHLQHVYLKLDVHSRVQLAARLADRAP